MKAAAEPLSVRVSAMDEAAIDCQVISLTNEPQLAAQGDAVDLVRGANDRLAEAVAKYPNRFCVGHLCVPSLNWTELLG